MSDRYNRRTALAGLGSVSLSALLAACGSEDPADPAAVPAGTRSATADPASAEDLVGRFDAAGACVQTADQTEGPFFFEVDRIRSDIDEGREGTSLRLGIRVRGLASCAPVPDAVVDVWHCDARGLYSGFEAASQGVGGGSRTDAETYLRGAQVTDRDGIVAFRTIYPGAYPGRTPHIHARVHIDRRTLLTTQLYFDDAVTRRVHAQQPYAGGDTANADDGLYAPELELTLAEEGEGWLGLITFDVRS